MPATLDTFKKDFPKAWGAYEQLRNACDQAGPLDAETVELIMIGIFNRAGGPYCSRPALPLSPGNPGRGAAKRYLKS